MRKLAILGAILCSIPLITYYIVWPPSTLDDFPQPSCTEMVGSEYHRSSYQIEDIMVGIRLNDRMGYAEFTSSVIRKYHEISDSDIHVFVEKEHDYRKSDLRFWYGHNVKIVNEKSREDSALKALRFFINSKYKILFFIDNEMVFLRSWRNFISQHLIKQKAPLISLYHSAVMHNSTVDCEKSEGNLCTGTISQNLGIAMTKDFAKLVVTKYSRFSREYKWNEILQSEKLRGLYPTKSIILKIGQSNQDKDFCGENDVPYRFQLCELPCWIRNGIEFYFDRCTNPQEFYSSQFSINQASIEKRPWVQPVIVYSFYGSKPRYVNGAIDNARRVFSIYPRWKIWIYIDNSVSPDVVRHLCSYNVRFVNMTGTHIRNKMSWRFLIASEPVKYFTILDIDYRMLSRGKEATDEWLQSDRKFHVMRDHPNHSKYPMSGSMWGGFGNSIPNIKELIVEYSGGNWYMMDIYFLRNKIWPIIKQSVLVHDAYSLHKFGEDHPFPTKRKGGEYVGGVNY